MNTGDRNTGNWNIGDMNTGDRNTGNWNTGKRNTGNRNTGDMNTDNGNTGNRNTGNRNTGDRNAGDMNTGDRNTGIRNTGDRNAGNMNTGDMNTGDRNTGNWNTVNLETGFLNTIQNEQVRVFNRYVDLQVWEEAIKPDFMYFLLTEWVYECDMTDAEKQDVKGYEILGGYLKSYKNKEAFQNSFNKLSKVQREIQVGQLKRLPNFDAEVFKEISGIDINVKVKRKIIIDNKEIEISEEGYEAFKKQFK